MKIQVDAFSMNPSCVTVGTSGSQGIPKLEFEFSAEWEKLSKKASFYAGDDRFALVIGEDNTAVIPSEVMANAGEYPFLVSGSRSGDRMISLAGKITVLSTLQPAVTPPGSPTPTEMEQIYDMLEETRELSNAAAGSIEAANLAAASANRNAAEAGNAAAAARVAAAEATAAAASVVSVEDAAIGEDGHLNLTLTSGETVDTGVARGCAYSGSYLGNGDGQTVTVGFRPAVLLISPVDGEDGYDTAGASAVVGGEGLRSGETDLVGITGDGFSLTQSGDDGFNRSGVHYRYVAFADDVRVLSSAVARKIDRPVGFQKDSIPVFTASGDLADGGARLNRLAPGIVLDSDIATYHEITDSAGGHPLSVTFYGCVSSSGAPSKQRPLYPEFASSFALEVEGGDYYGIVPVNDITLRALEVSSGEPYNYAKTGRGARYYHGDTLSDDGVLCRHIGYIEFDGSEDWHTGDGNYDYYLPLQDARTGNQNRFHCSHYNRMVNYDTAAFCASSALSVMHPTYPRFCVVDHELASLQAFKAYLAAQKTAGTPVRLWYQLETPRQSFVQLDSPLSVTLPANYCEVWSDTYYCFTYLADTKTYIDERVRELQEQLDALTED